VVEGRAAAREALQAVADLAPEQLASRVALEPALELAWGGLARLVNQREPAREAAQAVEARGDTKAHTLAQNRAVELSSEERSQAQPGAEDRAEAVLAAWAQAALAARARPAARADQAIREGAFRPGPPKMKTSWEF
jgi:hypothetical protein